MAVARPASPRPVLRSGAGGRNTGAGVAAVLVSGLVGLSVAAAPELLRLICALVIALLLVSLSFARPRLGVLATIVFLVGLTFTRRLLIEPAGWTSIDPLLLVGPVVVFGLLVRLFTLDHRPVATDGLSKLMVAVLVMSVLEIPNPRGGGIPGGLGGMLLVVVPTLWFFVGRELASPRLVVRLLQVVLALGVVEGAYGLFQTQVGFPSWDREWFFVNGYDSLNVGDTVRAFGTFSSSQEYALFLAAAAAVAASLAFRRNGVAALVLPLLLVALFLSSNRGALVTSFTAIVVVLSCLPRRPLMAVVIGGGTVVLAVGALAAFGSALGGAGGGNDLVSHQVDGITDPLDPGSSTLLTHITLAVEGVVLGVKNPLGNGTGATNQGGAKLSGGKGGQQATEVDISNAFVNLGLLGGVVYLLLVVSTMVSAFRSYFAGHDEMLPVIAVLIVVLGQWGTGGLYAIGPIVWLLVGYVAATAVRRGAASPAGYGAAMSSRRRKPTSASTASLFPNGS